MSPAVRIGSAKAPCHFARPLKQRLSKSDLAKIGDGKPDRVKAHVLAYVSCITLTAVCENVCVLQSVRTCGSHCSVHFFKRKCLRCLLCLDRLLRPGHQLKKRSQMKSASRGAELYVQDVQDHLPMRTRLLMITVANWSFFWYLPSQVLHDMECKY